MNSQIPRLRVLVASLALKEKEKRISKRDKDAKEMNVRTPS